MAGRAAAAAWAAGRAAGAGWAAAGIAGSAAASARASAAVAGTRTRIMVSSYGEVRIATLACSGSACEDGSRATPGM
jgi:hypothetical protein